MNMVSSIIEIPNKQIVEVKIGGLVSNVKKAAK